MISTKSHIRVRYAETDQMGFVYYGVYAQYYEIGRVDLIRQLGFSYKHIESQGIWLPVSNLKIEYLNPAYYDELLTLTTTINELPKGIRIPFTYALHNAQNVCLNTGFVELACINSVSKRPCKLPNWFVKALEPHFNLKAPVI